MRLHWSIVSLDPVFNLSNSRHWETDSYSKFHVASTRIVEIARESVDGRSRFLFHMDTVRATTAILQLLLRKVTPERTHLDKYIRACRDGIELCRSLVPKVLVRAEGIFEKLLNEYYVTQHASNCEKQIRKRIGLCDANR